MFAKRALEAVPVFISIPICFALESKGTEFCQELQKAAQMTAYGSNTSRPKQSDPLAYQLLPSFSGQGILGA